MTFLTPRTMDSDDKPFACSFAGCQQKFVTEDKLSRHMQKHELNFESLTGTLFPDQTPTPTTFLRDCENLGLFQDLGVKNPFDESFRQAVIDPDTNELVDSDGTETPSIPILPDSAAVLGLLHTPTSTVRDIPSLLRLRSTLLTPSTDKPQPFSDSLDTPIADNTLSGSMSPTSYCNVRKTIPAISLSQSKKPLTNSTSKSAAVSADKPSTPAAGRPLTETSKVFVVPQGECIMSTTVQDTQSSGVQNLQVSNVAAIPARSPQPTSIVIGSTSIDVLDNDVMKSKSIDKSHTPATVTLLMPASLNKIPDADQQVNATTGVKLLPNSIQFIKSILPATVSLSSVADASNSNEQTTLHLSDSSGFNQEVSTHILTKQKLKQALTKDPTGQHMTATPQFPSSSSQSTVSDSELQLISSHKRPASLSDDEHQDFPDDKRMKTLERNRDAARRCRKKKKVFIQKLEERLKEALQSSAKLVSENARLKMEVAELKSLFLAHKDCQVTKQQLSSGQISSLLLQSTDPKTSIVSGEKSASSNSADVEDI